jgi:hypothetical protein
MDQHLNFYSPPCVARANFVPLRINQTYFASASALLTCQTVRLV